MRSEGGKAPPALPGAARCTVRRHEARVIRREIALDVFSGIDGDRSVFLHGDFRCASFAGKETTVDIRGIRFICDELSITTEVEIGLGTAVSSPSLTATPNATRVPHGGTSCAIETLVSTSITPTKSCGG